MARGPIGMILAICFTAVGISGAAAQQGPQSKSSNIAQIQEIGQEMDRLRGQLEPINSKIQDLLAKMEALREKEGPIQKKLEADRLQLRVLLKQHG